MSSLAMVPICLPVLPARWRRMQDCAYQ
jgi:hypothetical protein